MIHHDETTLPALCAPTVLAIGCSPALLERCVQALKSVGAALKDCDIVSAATAAAERQPLAIVMLRDLHAFDPDEFDALARAVRATLVKVDEDVPACDLEGRLSVAIQATLERRNGKVVAGRYTIVNRPQGVTSPPSRPKSDAFRTGVRRKPRVDMADMAPPSSGRAGGY